MLYRLSNRECLFTVFNCTWPGDYRQVAIANRGITAVHDCLFRFEVESNQLVGFGTAEHFGHARQIFEMSSIDRALVAGYANGCAQCTGHWVRPQPNAGYKVNNSRHLAFSRICLHYNEHDYLCIISSIRTRRKQKNPPPNLGSGFLKYPR